MMAELDFVKEGRKMEMDNEIKNPASGVVALDAEDDESLIDGCEVIIEDETPDEDLPMTEGGVA
jgi:hypothetical protein